ncbi:MAG: hypothetical protein IPN14_05775 [Bacteroidetes bacterium]|nr:hypothetical protein [Bacteroidota bacterium]
MNPIKTTKEVGCIHIAKNSIDIQRSCMSQFGVTELESSMAQQSDNNMVEILNGNRNQ